MPPNLVWFRTDLRICDNPALNAAIHQQQPVLSLVFVTPQQWQLHNLGARKIQLIHNRINALQKELAELNIPLLIIPAEGFTDCVDYLQQLITQLGVRQVFFNLEYEVNERRRDIAFKQWCKQQSVSFHQFHDQCLLAPGEVQTGQQQMFKVFTPFKRAWLPLATSKMTPPLPAPAPLSINIQQPVLKWAKQQEATHVPCIEDALWPVAEAAVQQQLHDFIADCASDYDEQRDFPNLDSTSRLSPYLSLGILSPRQCLFAAFQHNQGQLFGGKTGLASWINELIWREFYRHLLVAFPKLSKHQVFKEGSEPAQWRTCEADFQAWCTGQTGYPLVDAAQRQLLAEGWMHNRLRMVSALMHRASLSLDTSLSWPSYLLKIA